jgi:hypothetical protein
MLPITKKEAMFLRAHLKGVVISHPTRHGKRFLEEADEAVAMLKAYRAGEYSEKRCK